MEHHHEDINLDDLRPDLEEESKDFANQMDDDDDMSNKAQKRLLAEMTKSISTRTIARTLIPKVSVLKKNLFMQHLLCLFEQVIDEINRMTYWNSILEMTAWVMGLLCFFAYPSGLGWIWMHIFHIPRGAVGVFFVLKKSPKTYELIDKISEFDEEQMDEKWDFEKMSFIVKDNFKHHITQTLNKVSTYFYLYFIITSICSVLDLIGLLCYVIIFGTSDDVYEPLYMLATV